MTDKPSPAAPDKAPYRARRERLLGAIGEGVAVFAAAPELVKSRDTEYPYRPDSNLYYLTGFREPEAVAVFTPHEDDARFILFVRPRDPEKEAWSGWRAGVEGACERFGADAAYPIDELDERLKKLLEPADAVWYALGDRREMDERIVRMVGRFRATRPRNGTGPTEVRDPSTLLDRWRMVKDEWELERIREATAASARGHRALMEAARPGVGEWELHATLEATFRAAGPVAGPAYEAIVGSAANATVLHYVHNERRVEDGDLVLVDAGAAVDYYCGDITRTFPVSGRFTPEQRRMYDIVHRALEAGIAAVKPGAPVSATHEAARRVLVEGMVELGLLSGEVDELIENEAFKRFFMHQTTHWLGLDVHDVGPYKERDGTPVTLEPGMVLTVEPGLYVARDAEGVPEAYLGVGVRLEDDVLVTADGHEVLTRGVPVDAEEVEALVGSGAG
jgi:Xaa-Pro aminopeptidase